MVGILETYLSGQKNHKPTIGERTNRMPIRIKKAARFYKALKFTTSSRSWKWSNVSPSLKRPKWGLGTPRKELHHWLIPRNSWGRHVPNRIKNQPWNLMTTRSKVWHDALHGKGRNAFRLDKRLWHGSPTWAKIGAAGTGVSLGNHVSRTK